MKSKQKTKQIFDVLCPWCGEPIQIHEIHEIIEPAVPAQKEISFRAFKDTQTKLKGWNMPSQKCDNNPDFDCPVNEPARERTCRKDGLCAIATEEGCWNMPSRNLKIVRPQVYAKDQAVLRCPECGSKLLLDVGLYVALLDKLKE